MMQTYDLTEGKVSRLILAFYFPMLFINLLQQVYNIVDTVIIAQGLGDNTTAAVGNMASLILLIVGFFNWNDKWIFCISCLEIRC